MNPSFVRSLAITMMTCLLQNSIGAAECIGLNGLPSRSRAILGDHDLFTEMAVAVPLPWVRTPVESVRHNARVKGHDGGWNTAPSEDSARPNTGTHFGTKESYDLVAAPFLIDDRFMTFNDAHRMLVKKMLGRRDTVVFEITHEHSKRLLGNTAADYPTTQLELKILRSVKHLRRSMSVPIYIHLFRGSSKPRQFGVNPYALLDVGREMVYAEAGTGGMKIPTRAIYMTQEFALRLSEESLIEVLEEEIKHADQKLSGNFTPESWDDSMKEKLYRIRKDLPLWSKVLAALPPETPDLQKKARAIADFFGNNWEEALSLLGWELLNEDRYELINRCLKASIPLDNIADFLHYTGSVQRFELFPLPFQNLVFKARSKSIPIVSRDLLDDLWDLYRLRHTGLSDAEGALGAPIHRVNKESFEKASALSPSGLTDMELVRIVKGYDTNGKEAAYSGWGVMFSLAQGLAYFPEQVSYLGIKFTEGQLFDDDFGQLGRRVFNIWLTDKRLIELLKLADLIPLETRDLFAGSVVYRETPDGQSVVIELLQSWFRYNATQFKLHRKAGRFPDFPDSLERELRLKLKDLGQVSDMLERSFRQFVFANGIRSILAPAGYRFFHGTAIPLHASTIVRLNDLYRDAGGRLMFAYGAWRWEIVLEVPIKSRILPASA